MEILEKDNDDKYDDIRTSDLFAVLSVIEEDMYYKLESRTKEQQIDDLIGLKMIRTIRSIPLTIRERGDQ